MSDNENDETNTTAAAASTPITFIDLVGDESIVEQENVEERSDDNDSAFQSIEYAMEPTNIGNLTRKRPRLEATENDNDDDDAAQCSICFDQWTQLGSHRVVSLACGHLFGDSCIRKWLASDSRGASARGKCPQCNRRCARKDIRPIWMQRAIAVDNSEVVKAQRDLADERDQRVNLEREKARLQSAYKMALRDLEETQHELALLKSRAESGLTIVDSTGDVAINSHSSRSNLAVNLDNHVNFVLEQSIPFTQTDSLLKVLALRPNSNLAYVGCRIPSQSSSQSKNSFGIVQFELDTSTQSQSICHSQQIRNICTHTLDPLVMSVSTDCTLQLSSFSTACHSVQTFELGIPGWSCAWHPHNPTIVAAGLINGSILLFDRRQPRLPLERLNGKDWLGTKPVHSLNFFESSKIHLAAANHDHAFAWSWDELHINANTEHANSHLLCRPPLGTFCYDMNIYSSTDHESKQVYAIFSHKSSQPKQSIYCVGSIVCATNDENAFSVTKSSFTEEQRYIFPYSHKSSTRSTIFPLPISRHTSEQSLVAALPMDFHHSVGDYDDDDDLSM
ncbi:hypothetical protein BDF22DRAFT_667899 [Syncephalis plumigaleata]|nr:hypothetical protein BDF22DRAFT_667899 [Syncephalis plumigaleata]